MALDFVACEWMDRESLLIAKVERWREALLWTFVVAKLGSLRPDGSLGDLARIELAKLLNLERDSRNSRIEVIRGKRETLSTIADVWEQAGLQVPQATEMLFCGSCRI